MPEVGAYSHALSSLTPMTAFTYRSKSISNRIIQVSQPNKEESAISRTNAFTYTSVVQLYVD